MPRLTLDDLQPWLAVDFERSGGPGGQNVNKVNTRATLLFDFAHCERLTPAEQARIAARLVNRLARDGRLRIVAQEARTQAANRAAAEARLLELLERALHVPKARRPTRPSAGARRRRVAAKRKRGELKQSRRGPAEPE